MTRATRPLPRLLCLVLATAVLAPTAAAEESAPMPTPEAVDGAIEKGVKYLLEEQRPDGTWGTGSRAFGHTVLAAYALLHSGQSSEEETKAGRKFAKALKYLDRHGPGIRRARDKDADTYSASLLALLLRDRGFAHEPRMKRVVALLANSQAANGQWSYAPRAGPHGHDVGDNSNTQFAILALGAAVGEGLDVPTDVLLRALGWWRAAIQSDGGYGYSSGGSKASASCGSMTAAGVASIAILEAALSGGSTDTREEGVPTSELLGRAIERLASGFEVDRNFGPTQGGVGQRQRNAGRGWLHYFLWSVERAMVLAGREHLGERDWYAEGAAHLLDKQYKDGSWRGEHPLYATCFALLFLTRAADPPRVFTPPDRPSGPVTGPEKPPEEAPVEPLPVGDVMDWLKRGVLPNELNRACLHRGPESLAVLVRALGDPDAKIRQRANETLRALLGDERVGRADRHPLARGRLRLWVRKNARFLEAVKGRFVLTE